MALIEGIAVAGIGDTGYYKRGTAPHGTVGMAATAALAACADAGVDPKTVDGFSSYGHDETEGPSLAAALGLPELRWSSMVWGGGGGGSAGALGHAAAAIKAGYAERVIVVRGHTEFGGERLRTAVSEYYYGAHHRAHGIVTPAQTCALRTQRLIEHDGVPRETLRAFAQACYAHANNNPAAVGHDIDLTDEVYESSRWIAEPYRLFDCSRENDGAAAVLVTRAEEAERPVHLVSVVESNPPNWGVVMDNDADYTSAGFKLAAERLWAETGLSPDDIDVVQAYENFTGAAIQSLIDHGFCTPETAGDVLTLENLTAPDGGLPVNTAGGNVAEGFMHGMNLTLEAVRQVRGDSTNQVPDVRHSLLIGGPVAPLVSTALLLSKEPLA